MTYEKLKTIFETRETIAVEFKRCGGEVESDVYESVCSFLNRFGGDIFLGVLNDGTVRGVPPKAAPDLVKHFIKTISNPDYISPTVYLAPEIIEYTAMFVIERDKMTVSNANRAEKSGEIEPDDFQPNPKNPIIASFFRNIGFADQLGSGVRNLYKYVRRYSGQDPQLIDGDIFKIIVPLDDEYSFDAQTGDTQNKPHLNRGEFGTNFGIKFGLNETQQKVIALMADNPISTASEIADKLGITKRQVEIIIGKLKSLQIIKREGAKKNGYWVVTENPNDKPL